MSVPVALASSSAVCGRLIRSGIPSSTSRDSARLSRIESMVSTTRNDGGAVDRWAQLARARSRNTIRVSHPGGSTGIPRTAVRSRLECRSITGSVWSKPAVWCWNPCPALRWLRQHCSTRLDSCRRAIECRDQVVKHRKNIVKRCEILINQDGRPEAVSWCLHRSALWGASVWGTEGREFKSPQPDNKNELPYS